MLYAAVLQAQNLSGRLFTLDSLKHRVPVGGAEVLELHSGKAQLSDTMGYFNLSLPTPPPYTLVVRHADFATDTLITGDAYIEWILQPLHAIPAIEVQAADLAMRWSALQVRPTELLNRQQLESTACCNLSESFESSATVDASFSDAVTGFRQIRMLGLAGRYAQLLTEAVPTLRGLSGTLGLSYFPGTWIRSIAISKGTGAVVQGFDAITGQINVELFRPDSADPLFLNIYANTEQRFEANLHTHQQINHELGHLLLVHGATLRHHMDLNGDHFLDQPINTQVMVADRWLLQRTDQFELQVMLKGIYDDRYGGELHFNPQTDKLGAERYGLGMTVFRGEALAKAALIFPHSPYQSLGLQLFSAVHQQDGYFGQRSYEGAENQFFANLIFSSVMGSTQHKYKTGLSWHMLDKQEKYAAWVHDRRQSIPGAFAEYSFEDLEHLLVLLGLRADHHNLYGWQVSPRLHLRYQPQLFTTLRLSLGTGFRAAEPFMDNSGYLASSRTFFIAPDLDAEKALNVGVGISHQTKVLGRDLSFWLDAFRTQFFNQVVVDADSDPQQLLIYNLEGKSFSNVVQAELGLCPLRGLELRCSYRYSNVQLTIGDRMREQPYTPRHRAVATANYTTMNRRWEGSLIAQWVGAQRLPDTHQNPEPYRMPQYSEPYLRLLAQLTHVWKNWEFYVGSENLTNFIQQDRIIAADDPFGPYFDASFTWGPLTGRMAYVGLRFVLRQNPNNP